MAKRNVGYEDLAKVNPRLVMLSISAYGQTGPYSLRPEWCARQRSSRPAQSVYG